MCILFCIECPNCERKKLIGRPYSICDNRLCVRLLDDRNPLAPAHRLADEPCHPSCNSEHCGIRSLHVLCFNSCHDYYFDSSCSSSSETEDDDDDDDDDGDDDIPPDHTNVLLSSAATPCA